MAKPMRPLHLISTFPQRFIQNIFKLTEKFKKKKVQ